MHSSMLAKTLETLRMYWRAEHLATVEQRRAQRALMLGACALTLQCLAWSIFFALNGMWLVMLAIVLLQAFATVSFGLQARHRAGGLGALMFVAMVGVISLMALIFDAPTEQASRSIHLFLLPLAVAAYMAFRESRAGFSVGLAVLSLSFFLMLEILPWAPFPELVLPDSLRVFGKWMNGGAAMLLFILLLHVLHSDAKLHADVDHELQQALRKHEFVLYFQPQLDQRMHVTGAEVLLRWQHPQHGLLMPSVFIHHAERNGLMAPLGQWVLEQACLQLKKWQKDPVMAQLELAVNVSQTQFRQDSFTADVLRAVQQHGIEPRRLELELTETLMALNMDDLQHKMQLLERSGLRFSLDDFGTGFSSLHWLRQLPLHTLKIDRSFVSDLPHGNNSAAIVKTLLGLAQSMALNVVAEGIEQDAQQAFLMEHGCPRFQGYLYSKPLPLQEFVSFVRKHNLSASLQTSPEGITSGTAQVKSPVTAP